MQNILNYINGEFLEPQSQEWLDNYEPSSGKVYSKIPNSDERDIALAVKAAENAFPNWSKTTIEERSSILQRISESILENLEILVIAEAKDNGKPESLARAVDIPRAASNFKFFSQAITQFSTNAHESVGLNAVNYTLRKPLGVVGCISPWNLPLYLFTWKIAPALVSGNCVVAKPSEVTPMTAYLLSNICHNATGEHIARTAAPMFKKLSLELGGKNPNLIFADCDYDKMLETTVRSSFANQGQICLCGSRIFVEASIYETFKKDFVNKVSQLNVGHPSSKDTNVGALVSKPHLEKVFSYIDKAETYGGKILTGGNKVTVKGYEDGYYLEPTVIEVSSNDCKLNQEEIFGPVVTLMPFKTEEDALQLANSVRYGLAATIWTNNLNRTMRLSSEIEAGIVWVNTWMMRDLRTPFGGMKDSGVGREGGFEALRFFTEPKNVCISYE